MLLALTIWDKRISPVCDVARHLLLLTVEGGRVTERREEHLTAADPMQQARRLAEARPDVLICGAISRPLVDLLSAKGVRVLPFVTGTEEEVVEAYLKGALPNPALAMPGCCGQGALGRGWRGQGRRGCRRGAGWPQPPPPVSDGKARSAAASGSA
jgi:predicted Fe-Mo cluster-binding NifX family protein